METTLILCGFISLLVALGVIVRPLVLAEEAPYFTAEHEDHEFDEGISLLETINELENDFYMGKLTQEEFDALSMEYKREYLDLKNKKA